MPDFESQLRKVADNADKNPDNNQLDNQEMEKMKENQDFLALKNEALNILRGGSSGDRELIFKGTEKIAQEYGLHPMDILNWIDAKSVLAIDEGSLNKLGEENYSLHISALKKLAKGNKDDVYSLLKIVSFLNQGTEKIVELKDVKPAIEDNEQEEVSWKYADLQKANSIREKFPTLEATDNEVEEAAHSVSGTSEYKDRHPDRRSFVMSIEFDKRWDNPTFVAIIAAEIAEKKNISLNQTIGDITPRQGKENTSVYPRGGNRIISPGDFLHNNPNINRTTTGGESLSDKGISKAVETIVEDFNFPGWGAFGEWQNKKEFTKMVSDFFIANKDNLTVQDYTELMRTLRIELQKQEDSGGVVADDETGTIMWVLDGEVTRMINDDSEKPHQAVNLNTVSEGAETVIDKEKIKKIHNEIKTVIEKALQDDGRLTEADREKPDIQKSIDFLKNIYTPEADQENAEAKNIFLVGITESAAINNVDHQKVADFIYGKGQLNVEENFANSWEKRGTIDTDAEDGIIGRETLTFRVDSSIILKMGGKQFGRDATVSTADPSKLDQVVGREQEIRYHMWGDTSSDMMHDEPTGEAYKVFSGIDKYFVSREAAMTYLQGLIAEYRKSSEYNVTKLDDSFVDPDEEGSTHGDEGQLSLSPSGKEDGGIEKEKLNFDKLLAKLKTTSDELFAFEQLSMLQYHDSGAPQKVVEQATVNILQNPNLAHQPDNLSKIFREFDDNQEIMGEFWKLPESKLTAFAESLAQGHTSDQISHEILLEDYNRLPQKYQRVYLAEFDKKYLPAKKALQGFLKELSGLAGTQITEESFFGSQGSWQKQLPEEYRTDEEWGTRINKQALRKDGLDTTAFSKYYRKFINWEEFKKGV